MPPKKGHSRQPSAKPLADEQTVTKGVSALSVTSSNGPQLGTLGSPVNAMVNFFKMDLSKMPNLYEYSFEIASRNVSNDKITVHHRRRIAYLLLCHHPNFRRSTASDYANIFISKQSLVNSGNSSKTYTVDYYEPEEVGPRAGDKRLLFEVTLTFSYHYNIQELNSYQTTQNGEFPALAKYIAALNIVLARTVAQDTNMLTMARREKFFNITENNERQSLGKGLDVYTGFFKSVRFTRCGLMVNLNVVASSMYRSGRLDKLIEEMIGNQDEVPWATKLSNLDSQLRRLHIETSYSGRRRRAIFMMARCADGRDEPDGPVSDRITFTRENGQPISVTSHFSNTYPTAHRSNLRALVVDVGGPGKPIFVPSDLCRVLSGEPFRGLLPHSDQTAKMIEYACRPPSQNQKLILRDGLTQLGVKSPDGPAGLFGFGISDKMTSISARSLSSPTLNFATNSESETGTGSWNMMRKRFVKPASPANLQLSWLEFLLPKMQSCLNRGEFLEKMQAAIRSYTGNRDFQIKTFDVRKQIVHLEQIAPSPSGILTELKFLMERGIKLVLVLLPERTSRSAQIYRFLKIAADVMNPGIQTVCTVRHSDTGMYRVSPGDLANLALKINCKLGGVNLNLGIPKDLKESRDLKEFMERRIMFVGADVVHPGQGAMQGAPSIAAVVASVDRDYAMYPGCYRLQCPNEGKRAVEFIQKFGEMCKERLELYVQKNKALPDTVIVYRDGVADNMFAEVLNQELSQLKQAYQQVYAGGKHPKTIFLVVKKRGHTRFFQPPGPDNKFFDRKRNPLPGLTVDSQITGGQFLGDQVMGGQVSDWYLTSHMCIQGTSRPAHYVILYDDLNVSANTIQYLTFMMCFLWPRSTKSIGQHPAARAADVMCDRAKIYLNDVYAPSPPTGPNRTRPVYNPQKTSWVGTISSNLKDTMFYI